jgi:hypothetical protein
MIDEEAWTSAEVRVKGQRAKEAGLSLTRSAISWTTRGEQFSRSLDDITAIALQNTEDDGLTAICHIAMKNGAEVIVFNGGEGIRYRIAYREFVARLIAFLGPERAAAVAFLHGPIGSARETVRAVGVGCTGVYLFILVVFLLFAPIPRFGGGWWISVIFLVLGIVFMLFLIYHETIRDPRRFDPAAIPDHLLPKIS